MYKSIHELARKNMLMELQLAVARSIDINTPDESGATPLHYAIGYRHSALSLWLLENGADPRLRVERGTTALHAAISYRLKDVVTKIVELFPDSVSIEDDYGNEPLWTAAFNTKGDFELVSVLINAGADSTHRNRAGLTPFDMAKRREDLELLRLLGQQM